VDLGNICNSVFYAFYLVYINVFETFGKLLFEFHVRCGLSGPMRTEVKFVVNYSLDHLIHFIENHCVVSELKYRDRRKYRCTHFASILCNLCRQFINITWLFHKRFFLLFE
jgi:hypothetical protein